MSFGEIILVSYILLFNHINKKKMKLGKTKIIEKSLPNNNYNKQKPLNKMF